MALKKCLYCGSMISDSARNCPKCGQNRPTDQEYKELHEKLIAKNKKVEEFWKKTIKCRDCSEHLTLKSVFEKKECPNCGCIENNIQCNICEKPATVLDEDKLLFFCNGHKSKKVCCECGKTVFLEKIIWHGGQGSCGFTTVPASPYCEDCFNKKFESKGGKCFIATATYGNENKSKVVFLRQFRDSVLLKNKLGFLVNGIYCLLSPPLANIIRRIYCLRLAVKYLFVEPLVLLIRVISLTICTHNKIWNVGEEDFLREGKTAEQKDEL